MKTSSPSSVAAAPAASLSASQSQSSAVTAWIPCSWEEQIQGLIFLPRMLAKGRQFLKSKSEGQDLMNGFLFGDFDYADRMILKFLRLKDARVLTLLREGLDDAAMAAALIRESGRTPDEIQAWSRYFRRINAPFTPMWDADEGRRAPGLGTSLLKGFYNYLMMPPVYLFSRIVEGIRKR